MAKAIRSGKSTKTSTAEARPRGQPHGASSGAARKVRPATAARSFAYQATDSVLRAATECASGIADHVHGLLDEQVGRGSGMMSQVARSTRLAASDMQEAMPHAAGLVESMADRLDDFAEEVRDKTVDQVIGIAADFTRRQPAITFGAAALIGFLAIRAVSNSTGAVTSVRPAAGSRKRSAKNG